MNIYETCPVLESEKFIIRLFRDEDCDDLLKVYSDKMALPFFNSDNCDGDNFYYATKERMTEAIGFWHMAYDNGWFVRLSIVDKVVSSVIGTVELCVRVSEDEFNNMGILRVDVRSDYEQEDALYDIFSLVTPELEEMSREMCVIHKVFGTKENVNYIDRVGVYLVPAKDGKVGVVKTTKGYVLLGGGLDSGESHEECIKRMFGRSWVYGFCRK